MKRYKIIDIHGRLKSVYRPIMMMQPYVDIGLAIEELPTATGWRSCYSGSRNYFRKGNPIEFEPFSWDKDGLIEAYSPLIVAYNKISSGQLIPPDSYRNVA